MTRLIAFALTQVFFYCVLAFVFMDLTWPAATALWHAEDRAALALAWGLYSGILSLPMLFAPYR